MGLVLSSVPKSTTSSAITSQIWKTVSSCRAKYWTHCPIVRTNNDSTVIPSSISTPCASLQAFFQLSLWRVSRCQLLSRLVLRNNNRYNGAFGFAQQKPLPRRVWICATITVTTARLVLRNKNRYKGAFGFAQQLPLQRRVWFCATIKVSLFSTFEEKCRRPQ